MISFIKGELVEIFEDSIVLESNKIGYQINVPGSLIAELPSLGSEMKIYTYLHVREDALKLFGFFTREDLEVFRLLIGVNGIGPKGALGILSVISPDDLRFAVLSDDVKAISKAPGVGAKTAQKLIIELKDKLKLEDAFEIKANREAQVVQKTAQNDAKSEAVLALTALGYSNSEALKAVQKVDITADMDVETILKAALKKVSLF
ncbi:MAG: Holliday junction branch migration protein RuvA [Lachnospiraceae bacterium]